MSKVIFLTNVIRRFGMMQQTLERLKQQSSVSADCACHWITDKTQWEAKWEKELAGSDLVLLKWMGTGLDTPFLQRLVREMQRRGRLLVPPTPVEMQAAMQRVYARRDKLTQLTGLRIDIAQEERARILCDHAALTFGHCYAMNGEAAFVDAKGDIYACSSLVGNNDFYLGNVFTGIEETLLEKTKTFIRESMQFCCDCDDFKQCGGGCFARWFGCEDKAAYGAECAMKRESIKQLKK